MPWTSTKWQNNTNLTSKLWHLIAIWKVGFRTVLLLGMCLLAMWIATGELTIDG